MLEQRVGGTGEPVESVDSLYIVIAAYNEGRVIASVVQGLLDRNYKHVIVVDDGSSDDCVQQAAKAGATVLRHPINLGQGAALQTGIRYACQQGCDYVVTYDADGQHSADDIPVLLAKLKESGADIVLGSRFLGSAPGMIFKKLLVLKAAILFTWITSGVKLTDSHNGFRVMNRKAAQSINILQNRMAHASEIIDQIRSKGLKYIEAPVTITYTDYSMRKGQGVTNAFNIVAELMVGRLFK